MSILDSSRVTLENCTPLASGNNRDVFIHPAHPNLLIKTVKLEAIEKRISKNSHWSKKYFRRYKHYENFVRECQEHIVSRINCSMIPHFLHTVVGFVDTDRGLGLVTLAETDEKGDYAKTLSSLIREGLFDSKAESALEKFLADFISSDVIITDLGHGNLVYAYSAEHGYHFVAIDGFGEKNLIPFNSMSRWCHLRSKKKRVTRLRNSVARALVRAQATQQSPAS